jgi:hypothetical protein
MSLSRSAHKRAGADSRPGEDSWSQTIRFARRPWWR